MRIFLAILAILFGVRAATAADLGGFKDSRGDTVIEETSTWTSLWIAALAGYSMSNTDLSLDTFGFEENGNIAHVDGFGGEGFDFTAQLGGDFQVGPAVIGAWVEYAFGGTESSVSLLEGAGKLDVEQQDTLAVFGRLGLPRGNSLWYVAGGYVWTEFDANLRFGDESAGATFDFSGPAAEIGVEHKFGRGIRGKLSARYTWLDSEELVRFGDEAGFKLDGEPGVFSVKAGLVVATDGLFSR